MKITLLLLISLMYLNIYSQSCEECKQRYIILYDNDVKVPAPDSGATADQTRENYEKWANLFYIAGGVKNAIWKDATEHCFVKLCAAFFTQPDSINSALSFGVGFPNLPPSGSAGGGADYLVYGIVTGSGGNYTLQLKLETAKSRESVKGVTVNFTSSDDPIQVGENAASYFSPLYSTIMDYEKKKRDEGEPYAIRPKIESVPEKKSLQKNEKTNVEFTLKDCDGQTIKDRTIELTSENGVFDKETVTTDESGKATAVFTAGMEPGVAKIQATLVYRMPTDASSVSTSDGGDAYINIEKPPYWKLLARYSHITEVEDQQSALFTTSKGEWITTNEVTISSLLDMASALPGTYYTNNVIAFNTLAGSHHFQLASNSNMVLEGYGYSNENSNQNCYGGWDPKSEDVEMWVDFGSREVDIQFFVPAHVSGQGITQVEKWDRINGHESEQHVNECDDTESTGYDFHAKYDLDTTWNKVEHNEIPQMGYSEKTVTNEMRYFKGESGVYTFGLDRQEVVTSETKMNGLSARNVTTYKIELFGELITDKATSVRKDDANPSQYFLFQNFPNPFNPTTRINYMIKEKSQVKLMIYDLLGRVAAVLVDQEQQPGIYSENFNGEGLSSGIYFYKLTAGDYSSVKKMTLIK